MQKNDDNHMKADAWADIMDTDVSNRTDDSIYSRVKPNADTTLFQLDTVAATLLATIAAADFAWGDYDNDGDLDLLIAGTENRVSISRIYRNDRGMLTPISAGLLGITRGQVVWSDYDVDGDLDVLVSGKSDSGQLETKIYQNHNGLLTDINADLVGLLDSRVAWGDFDSDGDPDLLLSGEDNRFYPRLLLYRNNAGAFVPVEGMLPFDCKCNVAWGDYNNDSLPDILMTSTGPYELLTEIFANADGKFRNVNANLVPVKALGKSAWRDYDSDGDLDVLISGIAESGLPVTHIYRNQNGYFTDTDFPLHPVWDGDAAWGDYDNDGDQDLLLTGDLQANSPLTRVYRNDRTTFTEINIGLPNLLGAQVAWGDYDSDRDLDIIFSGVDADGHPQTQLWTNHSLPNELPSPPSGLVAQALGDLVIFRWEPSIDPETPGAGLGYDLVLSRDDVADPQSDKQQLPAPVGWPADVGVTNELNYGLSTTRKLGPGQYTWAVRAVDSAAGVSAWSPVGQLTIQPDLTIQQQIWPEMAQPGELITITFAFSNTGNYPVSNIVLTSTLPAELNVDNIIIETDAGVAVSETNKSIVPLVSWNARSLNDESSTAAIRVWSVSDLAPSQGGHVTIHASVVTSAISGAYSQTLKSTSRNEPNDSHKISTTSLTVYTETKPSMFESMISFLKYQKLIASMGFGVICLILVAMTFMRF